jgi:hypothetical protein
MIIHAFAMPVMLAVCSVAEKRCQNWRGFFAGLLLLAAAVHDGRQRAVAA